MKVGCVMTDKRARYNQKRAKAKAKVKLKDKFGVNVRGGDAALNEFFDIAFPANPLPLTDDLFERLAGSGTQISRADFDAFKRDGAVYNPARNSFLFPMESSFED
jgi:hypothetical protein